MALVTTRIKNNKENATIRSWHNAINNRVHVGVCGRAWRLQPQGHGV